MEQRMKDIPRTRREYLRQKGPTPAIAIALAIALIIAFILFFVPALVGTFFENTSS